MVEIAVCFSTIRLGREISFGPILLNRTKKDGVNKTLTEEEVVKFCEKLPRYKRPRKVFFGDVPRNPTGKIEKTKSRQRYINMDGVFKVS